MLPTGGSPSPPSSPQGPPGPGPSRSHPPWSLWCLLLEVPSPGTRNNSSLREVLSFLPVPPNQRPWLQNATCALLPCRPLFAPPLPG